MSRTYTFISKIVARIGVACLLSSKLAAAEIEVRSEARCNARVIRLGDLCDIHAQDEKTTQDLANIELGPTPQQGASVTIRTRDIQDRVAALGLNLAEHRFTGSSSVKLNDSNSVKQNKVAVSSTQVNAVETTIVRLAQNQMLAAQRTKADPRSNRATDLRKVGTAQFDVNPLLTDDQIAFLSTRLTQLQLISEIDSTKMEQNIVLRTGGRDPQDITVKITLQSAAQVVVATRNVPRGVILTSYDVEMQPAPRGSKNTSYTSLEEVVGREASASIAPGQALDPNYVRAPLVIRRGEVVDVVVRSGGIQVLTKARAQADGGVGDVVQVGLLQSKESFVSRVSGPHTVEMLGSADAR